jgi:SAM-dependent methyltransferase
VTPPTDFVDLTEVAGDEVSVEQVERLARRYYWAANYCCGKDVLEVACGCGPGAGYLQARAHNYIASDDSAALLAIARRHYGERIDFRQFDALSIPLPDNSLDVLLIMEALYYLPDLNRFFGEATRTLRPGGKLLIATANKDLYDFNPSPHSHEYLGVTEFAARLPRYGFAVETFGDTPIGEVSARQRLLRPVKAIAASANMIPSWKNGKKFVKRMVFGRLVVMPSEVLDRTAPKKSPTALSLDYPDREHKVLFCAATLMRRLRASEV